MKKFIAPLSGLFIFSLASGYLMTLIPLQQHEIIKASQNLIGLTASAFYFGLLIASFNVETIVTRIGHIRSFAGFMAILCSSTLALGLSENQIIWILLRFIAGMATAGAYVVIESWLLVSSSPKTRGRVVSIYMISLYGAQAIGQIFIGIFPKDSLTPLILIGILLAISICPPVMSRLPHPEIESPSKLNLFKLFKLTPSGFLGCFIAGVVLGAFYGLLPIYSANVLHHSDEKLSWFMTFALFGGMLLQFPVGYLSDYLDRRKVLIGISILGCCLCTMMMLYNSTHTTQLALIFFIGGTAFTLYPVAISHASDHLSANDIVAGAQALLLSYSFGSCIGPLIASRLMDYSDQGLMIFFIASMGFLSLFFIARLFYRPLIYTSEEQSFVPLPRTTPVVSQIDSRVQDTESMQ
jgi:MFS family permease